MAIQLLIVAAILATVAGDGVSGCASNSTSWWCLHDEDYPTEELRLDLDRHYGTVLDLYRDPIAEDDPSMASRSLCPSRMAAIRPLRAVNSAGHWRLIVNQVQASNGFPLDQVVRIEECVATGSACPSPVAAQRRSKCVQKYVYQRLLTYQPMAGSITFPFEVEAFRFPASCACLLAASPL